MYWVKRSRLASRDVDFRKTHITFLTATTTCRKSEPSTLYCTAFRNVSCLLTSSCTSSRLDNGAEPRVTPALFANPLAMRSTACQGPAPALLFRSLPRDTLRDLLRNVIVTCADNQ